jgi:hypothetical protein
VVVSVRCGVWMPWYVMRTLRGMGGGVGVSAEDVIEAVTPVVPM